MKLSWGWQAPLLLMAGALLFFGCARRPGIENLPLPDPRELIAKAQRNRDALQDFSGAGSIQMSGPDLRRTALGLVVDHLEPDYLKLDLKGPLGIRAGTLVLAGDRYSLEFRTDHMRTKGKISDFEYPLGMNLMINGEDLRDLFLPLISVEADSDSLHIEKDLPARQFILSWTDDDLGYRLWADPYKPLFTRELITTSAGDTVWFKQLSDVRRYSGVFLPETWTIDMGQGREAYHMKLRLEQLQVNTGLSPDIFKIEADSTDDQSG